MMLEGRLAIDLFPGAAGDAAKIASTRPLRITRQFAGHRPEEVLRTVSLLFAVCRSAKSAAAAPAFEQALGIETDSATKRQRALAVLMETAREHALRILTDWPTFLPERASASPLKELMKISRDFELLLAPSGPEAQSGGALSARIAETSRKLAAFLSGAVFGEDLACWQQRASVQNLVDWASCRQTPAQRLIDFVLSRSLGDAGAAQLVPLPALAREWLAERLFSNDSEEFVAAPQWNGQPCETSPLSRQRAYPMVAALSEEHGFGLAACLVELAAIPALMLEAMDEFEDAFQPAGDGVGVAQIEAARGRLVHAVHMDGGRVGAYCNLAPTEWNFHPQGCAARGLERIAKSGREDAGALARLFVTAADPCVGYEVRVH